MIAIPNQCTLINTPALQEGKDSSEIESFVPTHDELFKNDVRMTVMEACRLPYEHVPMFAAAVGHFKGWS